MNVKQLQEFCRKVHPKTFPPYTYLGFTYATNGYIMVRVPELEGIPEWEALNCKIAAKYFSRLDLQKVFAAMVEIPEFRQPERCPCKCKDADNIHGEGKTIRIGDVCPHCDGVGSIPGVAKIAVGKVFFGSQYLTLLKELPGVKIAPLEKRDANYFRWTGGEGLLMPMRP